MGICGCRTSKSYPPGRYGLVQSILLEAWPIKDSTLHAIRQTLQIIPSGSWWQLIDLVCKFYITSCWTMGSSTQDYPRFHQISSTAKSLTSCSQSFKAKTFMALCAGPENVLEARLFSYQAPDSICCDESRSVCGTTKY